MQIGVIQSVRVPRVVHTSRSFETVETALLAPVSLLGVDFELTEEQRLIRRQIRELCSDFGDEYWREKDRAHEFGWEFFDAFAEGGWCGITIPEEYGGEGYGVQEASIVQQEIARSGAAMAGHVDHLPSRLQRRAARRLRIRGAQRTISPRHRDRRGDGLYWCYRA